MILSKTHKTAIKRNRLSVPVRHILTKVSFNNKNILDFGCGRGDDVSNLTGKGYSVVGYDPHYFPYDFSFMRYKKWDIILCTYVLNVIRFKKERDEIVRLISNISKKAYITVRKDIPKYSKTQYRVELDYPVLYHNSKFCIYQV